MSVRLHAPPAQARRPAYQHRPRSLIKCSDPPQSPATYKHFCEATDADGHFCKVALSSEEHHWCPRHAQDLKDLNLAWEKVQKEAEKLEVWNTESSKQKMLKLQSAVSLRRRMRERFHTRGVDTADYTRWIAKVEQNTKALAESIPVSRTQNCSWTPETPHSSTHLGEEESHSIMVTQSPFSSRIPLSSLQRMPGDGIVVLKQFQVELCEEGIRRLYSIVPDLDDSSQRSDSPTSHKFDHGAEVMRAWFRIMILNDSEAKVLELASRSRSIDDFLRGCPAIQLEMYCDYFQNAWRPHAVQYLRVAICAQTMTGTDARTVHLLGGIIPSSTEGLAMTKPSWDILYRWFPNLFTAWTVASICSNFEDYTTICKLLMLGLYREHWYDPKSLLAECSTSVYLGFVPINKGDYSTDFNLQDKHAEYAQSESRNWLCGQMAMGDSFTRDFLEELQKRTDRLFLVVYEGTNADATVPPIELDFFINRYKSAKTREDLRDAEWTVSMTLEDIKNELRLRKTSMYDTIVVDSWQFIIIDRDVGQPFELINIVEDALCMLAGDPTPREIAKRIVRSVIPSLGQETFLEEMTVESVAELRYPPPHNIQYEGNRFRCHDPDRGYILARQRQMASQKLTRDERRFIRRVCEDMERCGIISLLAEHVDPQTRPLIIQGSDGALDLYFPYERTNLVNGERALSLPFPPAPAASLFKFAQGFKVQCPNGIMAKGSIQTHYCAWPMPAMRSLGDIGSNFATTEGHVYRWNAMPFDHPWSTQAWHYYIQHHINNKFPFVMFYLSSFVICALDEEDAERKIEILLEETEDRGWRVSIPKIKHWKLHVQDLKLDALYSGVRPADDF